MVEVAQHLQIAGWSARLHSAGILLAEIPLASRAETVVGAGLAADLSRGGWKFIEPMDVVLIAS